eukprot:tig00020910_g15700.t1
MPFGSTDAPSFFQYALDTALTPAVVVHAAHPFIDDLPIAAENPDQLIVNQKIVLHRLRENNIKLRMEKSDFGVDELPHLAHIISGEGVRFDPRFTDAVRNYEAPKNKKEVLQFMV